jgi:hypothetical protein
MTIISGGPGKVPHLAGVKDVGRQACLPQGGGGQGLITTRGLQKDELGPQGQEMRDECLDTGVVVGLPEADPSWPDGDVQLILRDVDANK